MKKFKKLVVLDRIILSEDQWKRLRNLADEVIEYSGLTPKQIVSKLEKEQGHDPGAVCFTALAKEQKSQEEIIKRLEGADAAISCWTNIPDKILKESTLKYVGFWTNLVNHRINLDLAKELGITVTYIPDYGTIAVAEYTFALILELARKTALQHHNTLSGKWPYELLKTSLYVPSVEAIPYHTLHGKRLGLIGFGRIGQHVAKIAQGFGMNVSYFSRHKNKECEEKGVNYHSIEQIMRESDIVSVHLSPYAFVDDMGRVEIDDHAPDCPEAENVKEDSFVIGKEELDLLKPGAIFINTAAGRLVDEHSLLEKAANGDIRVAIDVYQSNPDKKIINKVMQKGKYENIFTYRGGWLTYESVLYKGDSLIQNIKSSM